MTTATEATDLARTILADSEDEHPTAMYVLNVREARTLADAVIRLADLADELSEAGRESYQEGLNDAGDAYQAAALLIHAALNGETHA